MDKSFYKNILVFAEQREGIIQPVALELLGKASELAALVHEKVIALLVGYNIASQAQLLIEYGADEVIVVDDICLKDYLTEPYTQAVSQALDTVKPGAVLFGATTIGRDLAPRLSARLKTGLTADCTGLEIDTETNNLLMTRPAFGGNLMATIICDEHRPQMSTVRPGVMRRAPRDASRKGTITPFAPQFNLSKSRVRLIETVRDDKGKIDITEAKILISGGRGIGTTDGFTKLYALAEAMGSKAEVSSSRAMVDAGLIDHARQVGQTGKTVRPDLYLACGISGAIQHLAGMEEADFIVAINKDKFAPIFQVADVGIVGDVHRILPLLIEKFKAHAVKP
ncbi:MAG: electron transfer flavoprotein subunit alpha/FixB family protein [Prevotellaceae bacterium]|jgi:electron transfer flavoprotein alpha subunit|nr:electron transfer flavoprotein subunit alpha/FixB family protein [Prevotellaceae bacterium]